MTERERFATIMSYGTFDRMPVYFFGTWPETKMRWKEEGLSEAFARGGGSGGPQLPEMDEDWETDPEGAGNIWNNQGIINPGPLADGPEQVLEQTATERTVRSALGGVARHSTVGSSIPLQLEPDLKPTRQDWARFKRFLDPSDPRRWPAGWQQRAAANTKRTRMTCFLAGSLYGWLRGWMGVEAISYLMYDDPALLGQMVEDMADYFLALAGKLQAATTFDFGYVFEDCCGRSGPLLPPDVYRQHFDAPYRRMLRWYHDHGVKYVLVDSDGDVKDLMGLWLESGFDIVFPIEVGVWGGSPVAYRQQYGKRLRMMGGVNKHVIAQGAAAIRKELEPLRPLAEEGGFVPMPDHRIPPDCSLEQFRTYVKVFKEVFGTA